MDIRAILGSTVLHGATIVALVVWVQPWATTARAEVVPIAVAHEEATDVTFHRLPPPDRVEVDPLPDAPLEEQEVVFTEPEPEFLPEDPEPIPWLKLEPIPELIHRVVPIVVRPEPPVEIKRSEPPTEEALEPRPPQDYVESLQLDKRNKPPKYPRLARRLKLEADVLVAIEVTRDGRAGKVWILEPAAASQKGGENPGKLDRATQAACTQMDNAVLRALRKWHYPKIMQGKDQVQMVIQVPIRFRLQDAKG